MARRKFADRPFDAPSPLIGIVVPAQEAILGQQTDGLPDLSRHRVVVM